MTAYEIIMEALENDESLYEEARQVILCMIDGFENNEELTIKDFRNFIEEDRNDFDLFDAEIACEFLDYIAA